MPQFMGGGGAGVESGAASRRRHKSASQLTAHFFVREFISSTHKRARAKEPTNASTFATLNSILSRNLYVDVLATPTVGHGVPHCNPCWLDYMG